MQSAQIAKDRYSRLVFSFLGTTAVSSGTQEKKGFGASALKINNKIFAMLSSKHEFVIKLSADRVNDLISQGKGARFDPGHGRLMKEWIVIHSDSDQEWHSLSFEAMQFVSS